MSQADVARAYIHKLGTELARLAKLADNEHVHFNPIHSLTVAETFEAADRLLDIDQNWDKWLVARPEEEEE